MNRRSWLTSAGLSAAGMTGLPTLSRGESHRAAASGLSAVWLHGTSVQVEDPSTLTGTQRVGWGTLFSGKPGGFAWFHIAIATPVLLDDLRAKLERVFVFYKTSGASIRNVHVYDGPRKVKAFDGLTLQGDYSGKIVPANTWAFDPPRSVGFSVGISVGVAFDIGMDSAITTNVLFTTAGADFRFGVGDEIRRTIDRQSPVRPPGP